MKKISFNEGWLCDGKPVHLPHDAMLSKGRSKDAPGGSALGFFLGGKYEYSKRFQLPQDWQGQRIRLQFEGVYKNAQVVVNGKEYSCPPYGYIPFALDLGTLPEGENEIILTCDNSQQPDSRWYTGAGIYRPVWAYIGEGLLPEEVKITTISTAPAKIRVELAHAVPEPIEILDGEAVVAAGNGPQWECELPDAKLWSAETPNLYTCRIGGTQISFGIRSLSWSRKGFFVNGQETLLRGGCVHHDNGILGAATYDESEYRRVAILKAAGYNAIRASHNPCSRAMLDACDELGMYIIDETWDMWFHHKNPYDYASQWKEYYRSDIDALVDRDYNHPSVIMYSVGNELSEPVKPVGEALVTEITEYFHELDATRPVTCGFNLIIIASGKKGKQVYDEDQGGMTLEGANQDFTGMNSTMFNLITYALGAVMNDLANGKAADEATKPALAPLDIAGYNYGSGRYSRERKANPDRILFGSETFPQDIGKNWAMVKKYPYVIGDFMWTAWDYLGEAGLGAWSYEPDGKGLNKPYPWLLADAGAFDILGDPNGEAYWAGAVWETLEKPAIAVRPVNCPGVTPAKGTWRGTNAIPSWSWRGCEGNPAVVEVYCNCAKVRLLLNGKAIGSKKTKHSRAVFKTKYAPGILEAVAFDAQGRELGRNRLCSAQAAEPCAFPEKQILAPGEIGYIPIVMADEAGVAESNQDRTLTVHVVGGELLAFGSANPRTEESYLDGCFTTYYGRALAVVRAGGAGVLKLEIDGREAAVIPIR